MSEYQLIGHNYTTPDLVAKVTGRAKYSEDFRADGMLFAKLLVSPMPHARVRSFDASEALKMPGVHAILTANDLPRPSAGGRGRGEEPNVAGELALTNEPVYQGEPVLALAAEDELTAADAIEKIVVDWEPLPFAVDPIACLHPNSPNPRLQGNAWIGNRVDTFKWSEADLRDVEAGRLPLRDAPDKWEAGDVEAGFKQADLIIDETVMQPSTSHQPMEPRSAMAYWQNGKVYVYGSIQSVSQHVSFLAQLIGIEQEQLVFISEYCGGGFGSKNPGTGDRCMAIPALLSKKAGRPVMMRFTREDEQFVGRARGGLAARVKIGFRKDGRITAFDLFEVFDSGPYNKGGDAASSARVASCGYQPLNMRFRSVAVLTNTPPRGSQRGPGSEQALAMFDPLITEAAIKLGIDQVEIRKINAPQTGSPYDAPRQGVQPRLTGAFVREALDKGAEMFKWEERKQRNGQKRGNKVTGVGVCVANYQSGTQGWDGLVIIKPDGRLYVHQGIGNLGALSVFDTARTAAEYLSMPWDQVEVVWGDTSRHLPWSSRQGGSQTTHAHTRANYVAAMDAKQKLQEIAAMDLGGRPEDYDVGNGRVFRKGNPNGGLTFAHAATRAIALGGKYDGHQLPDDINRMTRTSATALAGLGVIGVAKDNLPHVGDTRSFVAGFAEVEVDIETGDYKVLDYLCVADVGTVLHPHSIEGQMHGGAIQGMGHAHTQKWVYDQHYGVALAKRFYQTRPPTILDIPLHMDWAAVGIPDPQTPVGAKGVAEPSIGAGVGALKNALAAALGADLVRRTPVTLDIILNSIEAGKRVDEGLTTHV